MDKPVNWCLGWDGNIELGFENGTYLPRKAAMILYPKYFDEHGEPRTYMLPIDGEKMKVIKVIVDKKPDKVTDCIFLKVGLFCDKCKLTKQRIGKVCFTDKCPLEESKENKND